jgi:hypothetical protein
MVMELIIGGIIGFEPARNDCVTPQDFEVIIDNNERRI